MSRAYLAAVLTAAAAAAVSPGGVAGSPVATTVASGPAKSLGEPVAARDSAVSAVAATSFGAPGARAVVWTRRVGEPGWTAAGAVLPGGFGSSYDASATAVPGGPLLVVAGTAPPGQSCIQHGSVAIAGVGPDGRLGHVRLVSDQRGTGSFDDRPVVAAGANGTVWVAWSQGGNADACADVGGSDRIEVAASRDGGVTFGPPVVLPSLGGSAAFGARLAPLPGGRVAVGWAERRATGDEAMLVSVLGPSGVPSAPRLVLAGDVPPLVLPGASFYDFPAGDLTWVDNRLVVAMPLWRSGHAVIALATGALSANGAPAGPWLASAVSPPSGADLLLPALAPVAPGKVLLLCAVHWRAGDRLGYEGTDLSLAGSGNDRGPGAGTPAPVTPAPQGPGFYEIGEELSVVPAPGGVLAAVVVAGTSSARLQALAWQVPATPKAPSSPAPASKASSSASVGPAAPGGSTSSRAPGTRHGYAKSAAAGIAALFLLAALLSVWRRRRRGA